MKLNTKMRYFNSNYPKRCRGLALHSALVISFSIFFASIAPGQHFTDSGTDSNGLVIIDISETFEDTDTFLAFFDLDYSTTDHHVQRLAVRPPYDLIDPFLDFIYGLRDGSIALFDDGSPFLSYAVDWRLMDRVEGNQVSRVAGFCLGGSCSTTVPVDPAGGVFVLSGFSFQFSYGDRHIDEIGVIEDQGVVTVSFSDKNGDDPFSWEVLYIYLPQSAVATTGTAARSAESFSGTAPITSGDVVISGFHFDFSQGDRHLRRVSVDVRNGGSVDVFYQDKSPSSNETYSWLVNWAELE